MTQRWFRRYRPAPPEPRLRLICFPHAGGAPVLFRTWPAHLPADVDVLSVCYPGRHDRLAEPCVDRMDLLADLVTEAVTPLLDRPLVLFGHSMGALVAYEVAVRLAAIQHAPHRLVVSAHRAPNRIERQDRYSYDDAAIIAEVRGTGGTGSALLDNDKLRALVLPAIRADHRLLNTYYPENPGVIAAPITGYLGRNDPLVHPEDMAAWAELTSGGFELRTLPGEHFSLVAPEAELVADLRSHLAAVSAANGTGPVRQHAR